MTGIRKRNRKGFLLWEALVAVVLLSLGIALVVRAMGRSLRSLTNAAHYLDAFVRADNEMARILRKPFYAPDGNTKTDKGCPNERYRFDVQAADLDGEPFEAMPVAESPRLRQLRLRVTWTSQGKERYFQWHTYTREPSP